MSNIDLSKLVSNVSIDSDIPNSDFVSTFSPKKYWKLNDHEYENFWDGYCNILDNISKGKSTGLLNLAERVDKYCPVVCDCTIKFNKNDTPGLFSSQWTDKFVIELVYAYQKAIFDNLLIDNNGKSVEGIAFVMELDQEHYDSDGNLTYLYRIQFPFCRVEPLVQKRILKNRAIQILNKRKVINIFPETPAGDWDKFISSNSVDEYVTMYGSVSSPSKQPLKLTKIYDKISLEDIENDTFDEYDVEEIINEICVPARHRYVRNGLISPSSFFIDMENEDCKATDNLYYIPFILSINYSDVCIRLKQGISINEMSPTVNKLYSTPTSTVEAEPLKNDTDIDIAETLLPLLNNNRILNDHFCLDIGKSLYNSDKTESKERAFKLWVKFTEKVEGKDQEFCEEYWESFGIDNSITVKTIAWYARIDSPVEYERWHKNKYDSFLERSLSCTHDDVALAFYWIYWLDFICSSVKTKTWYVFMNHILREADSDREIRTKISDDFKRHYEILQKEISDKITSSKDEHMKSKYQMDLKKIGDLIKKLKTVQFKANLMTALLDLFKNDNFARYANMNERLFGVGDGIIECCDKYATYRPGKPEDYVTIATSIKYPKNITWEHPSVKRLMVWFKQIFISEDLMTYFIRLISSCLRSKNKEKIMGVFSGAMGNNSKSMVKRLIETVFGPYSHTFPGHAFTNPKKGGASPEFAAAKYAKIGWVNEPPENAHLQADEIKLRTGMDKVNDRMLYENGGEYIVMYTLLFICNKIPLIPGADNAIMNRLRVVPFDSVWAIDAPDDVDEQYKLRKFKLDRDFESKIPHMTQAALWLFVETYKDYATKGLGQPAIVTKVTNKYFSENDFYKAFIDENIEKAIIPGSKTEAKPEGERDLTCKVKFTDLYSTFKSWVRVTFPSMKVPDSPVFLFHMNQRIGKPSKKDYIGIKVIDRIATI